MGSTAGVPDEVAFASKPQIATAQVREARRSGAPDGVVLADPGTATTAPFVMPLARQV
jgi:SRSO17 transposase